MFVEGTTKPKRYSDRRKEEKLRREKARMGPEDELDGQPQAASTVVASQQVRKEAERHLQQDGEAIRASKDDQAETNTEKRERDKRSRRERIKNKVRSSSHCFWPENVSMLSFIMLLFRNAQPFKSTDQEWESLARRP